MLSIAAIKGSLSAERWELEKDVWYIRHVLRPSAVFGAWIFIKAHISSKAVVLLGLLVGLAGCCLVAFGPYSVTIGGCVLIIVGSWLDYVDGTVARATCTVDNEGAYLDLVKDNVLSVSVPLAAGFATGMYAQGVLLALLCIYSTLTINDGRHVFGDEDVYRTKRWSLWRLAFMFWTNVQAMYLLFLLIAVVTGHLPLYLYVFMGLTGCEIVAVIARRL